MKFILALFALIQTQYVVEFKWEHPVDHTIQYGHKKVAGICLKYAVKSFYKKFNVCYKVISVTKA